MTRWIIVTINTCNNKEILGALGNKKIRHTAGLPLVVAELIIETLIKIDISAVESTHLHLLMVLDGKQNTDQEKELELLGSARHQVTMIDLVVVRNKLMVSNLKQNPRSIMTFKNIYILQVINHRIAMQGKETVMDKRLKPRTDMINVEAHQVDTLMIYRVCQLNGIRRLKLQAEMWIRWIVTSKFQLELNSTARSMDKQDLGLEWQDTITSNHEKHQPQMEGMTHTQEEMLETSLIRLAMKQDSLDHLILQLPEASAQQEKLQINYTRELKAADMLKTTDMEAVVAHNKINRILYTEETEVPNRIDTRTSTRDIRSI